MTTWRGSQQSVNMIVRFEQLLDGGKRVIGVCHEYRKRTQQPRIRVRRFVATIHYTTSPMARADAYVEINLQPWGYSPLTRVYLSRAAIALVPTYDTADEIPRARTPLAAQSDFQRLAIAV